MPIFSAKYYQPSKNAVGYREAVHKALAQCVTQEEKETLLLEEASEITSHVTEGIRDLIKHNKKIHDLVLNQGAIPLATWAEALDSRANRSLVAMKKKVDEMKRDLEQGKVESFPGTMILYGKQTFTTLEEFYDVVFEGLQ
jgi:pyruvate-formate lyase